MEQKDRSLKDINEESKEKYLSHKKQADFHHKEYLQHLAEATTWKKIMDISASTEASANGLVFYSFEASGSENKTSYHNLTFAQKIEDLLLKANIPMLTRELMDAYNKMNEKQIIRKDFSSKMSIASAKGKLKSIKFDKNPNDRKYWWALDSWVDGKKNLKTEYLEKIQQHIIK